MVAPSVNYLVKTLIFGKRGYHSKLTDVPLISRL